MSKVKKSEKNSLVHQDAFESLGNNLLFRSHVRMPLRAWRITRLFGAIRADGHVVVINFGLLEKVWFHHLAKPGVGVLGQE